MLQSKTTFHGFEKPFGNTTIMAHFQDRMLQISTAPSEKEAFDAWVQDDSGLVFLRDNANEREFVVYAGLDHSYIHAVLAPAKALAPPDFDDLLSWNFNMSSSWSPVYGSSIPDGVEVLSPLHDTGSKSLDGGEQLVFYRHFEGLLGKQNYFEVLQKFLHLSDLHFMPERNAYCRLDNHGDIEDVIRIIDVTNDGNKHAGTIITFDRAVLDKYAVLTDTVIVRTFDFIRYQPSRFGGWPDGGKDKRVIDGEIFYRARIFPGLASYVRGCQILRPVISKRDIANRLWGDESGKKKYISFIAQDWKNGRIREISCAPGATVNYFTRSGLPFEMSPAFFRAEVLAKYKADSDKYRLETRSISCRGAWHLQTYDINEEGQVHTYLVYLGMLPYEEQLHWKQYNEMPKGPISKRAFATDFEGSWDYPIDPLSKLKSVLGELNERGVPWWKLRSEKSLEQVHDPVTASADEWANELLHLDQLVVEGFETKWLKQRAIELKRTPDSKFRSLKLVEECLLGLGYEPERAREIVAPLQELHHLRSKLKSHVPGKEALEIKKTALTKFGSYRMHFESLCGACVASLQAIAKALQN